MTEAFFRAYQVIILKALIRAKKHKRPIELCHTGSSWADFNHGLVVPPQGCHGCQKIHKNILKINLLIQSILNELQKSSRSLKKLLIFGRTS